MQFAISGYLRTFTKIAFYFLGRPSFSLPIGGIAMFTIAELLQNQECEPIRRYIRELVRESRLDAMRFARLCLASRSLREANLVVNTICEDLIPPAYR